jgi:hypothetical protein
LFSDQQIRISEMEIGQSLPARDVSRRDRLPNKRACETIAFEQDGSRYCLTVGFYEDGRPGEIFLNHDRGDSLLDFLMSDAAILASLALQYGAPLDEIRHALKRDGRGQAASALDRVEP